MSPFIRSKAVTRGDRLVAGAVLLLLLAVYTATFAGLPDNPDSEVEYQTTSALARNRTLALGGTPEADAIVGVVHQGRQGFDVRRGGPGREDRYYSWFGVGQALVGLPFWFVGAGLAELFPEFEERHRTTTALGVPRSEYFQHLVVGWRNPLLTALTAALIVMASRHFGTRRSYAMLAGLSYGLCTFAWPQGRSTLSGVQATFFLFAAFVAMLLCVEAVERYQRPGVPALLSFGLCLGMAFLTRAVLAPAVVVLAIAFPLFLHRGWRRTQRRGLPTREILLASLPALLCLGFFLWINERRFGDPLETGYGDVLEGWFSAPLGRGLLYLFLSPGAGLLWMAPGCLLVVLWIRRQFSRRRRGAPLLLLGLFGAIVVPVALIPGWHGAWTYGPRYLLPLLPFLWLGVGPAFEALRERPKGRFLAYGLIATGLVTSLPGVLVDYMTHNDLAVQAARIAYPDVEGVDEFDKEEARFVQTKLDLRFAAPWAHWRILRHRIAGLGENYPVREIFFLDSDEVIQPVFERSKGFLHFAWVDFKKRLAGPVWPGIALCVFLAGMGFLFTVRGLDPDQP